MIYGYCRVSTKGQLEGNSIEDQTSVILSKYENAQIVIESYSAAKERPIFTELLGKLTTGDLLVVTKLDRFCRTTKEGLSYIDMLMGKGVHIHILNMGLIGKCRCIRKKVAAECSYTYFEYGIDRGYPYGKINCNKPVSICRI